MGSIIRSSDPSPEGGEPLVDPLIPPFDLTDVVDFTRSLRPKSRDEKGHARADVGALDDTGLELPRAYHDRTMRIAQND